MSTFALVSLQAIDIFLFIFNLFPLFAERGRRNWEEIIHNENHWPQLLHKSGVECQIDRFACFAAYFSSFPKESVFQSLEENLWTINRKKEFPDFSLTLTISKIFPDLEKFWFFPDVSLTVATLVPGWYLRAKYTDTWIRSVFFTNVYSLYRYKTNIGNWLYAFKIYFHTEYTASKNICFHAKKHVTVRKRWNGCEI